jgi:hypothetical protein
VRKRQPQRHGATDNLALAPDRPGLKRHYIEVEAARKPLQQVVN